MRKPGERHRSRGSRRGVGATPDVAALAKCTDRHKIPEWVRLTVAPVAERCVSMRRDVRGRVVLVTGASRGIGRRAAERLAKLGAILALTARSIDDLNTVVGEVKALGAEAEAFPGDLTKPEDR